MIVRRHGCLRTSVYLQERHVAQAFQEALFARIPPTERVAKILKASGALDAFEAAKAAK